MIFNNILLIQPKYLRSEQAYPIGLSYIAAHLKQHGYNVLGVDMAFSSVNDVVDIINSKNISIIGVSLISYNFKNALKLCEKIKKYRPDIKIVAGGPHATLFGEKIINSYKNILDYVISGNGEKPFLDLLDALKGTKLFEDVSNLIYMKDNKVIVNKSNDSNVQFPRMAHSDRSLFPVEKYQGMFTLNREYTQIITSRGCNRKCKYCPEPKLNKYWEAISVKTVVDEIEEIISAKKIYEFHIEDSNFLGGGGKHIYEFCNEIINRNLNIKWQCPNGLPADEFKDISLLEKMSNAGCYNICLGVETFDKEVHVNFNRESDFHQIKSIVDAAHKHNIEVCGYFIIGFPGQSLKSIKNDILLAKKLNLDFVQYSIFQFIPGAEISYKYKVSEDSGISYVRNAKLFDIGINKLRRIRTFANLEYSLRIRPIKYAFRRLIRLRNPLKMSKRAFEYIFGL